MTGAVYKIAGGVDIADRSLGLAYDAASRLSSVSSEPGGAAGAYQTTYSYLDSGEIKSRTLSYEEGGSAVDATSHYTYDISGRLTAASAPAQGGTYAFTWDADSRLERVDLPSSGGYIAYSYYAEGLTHTQEAYSASGAQQAAYAYAYDDRGQRTQAHMTLTGDFSSLSGDYAYTYDGAGRLESFTPPASLGPKLSYAYDPCGNLDTITENDITVVSDYAYDAANQVISGPGGTYAYDPFGNLVRKGDETFSWDGFGRLTATTDGSHAVSFTYDPLGRLSERKVDGTIERAFRYDGTSLSQAQETDGGGAGNVTTTYALSPSGTHLAQDKGGTVSYMGLSPHTDVSFTLDTQGSITGARVYDPYGNALAGGLDSSLGYQEDYTDPASGLVWMGARWYSPELTRFLSVDPLKGETDDPLSQNPYLYCDDDPVNAFDPTGKYYDPDSEEEPTISWDISSKPEGMTTGEYWNSMADPIQEERAAATERWQEQENFERWVEETLEQTRADLLSAIQEGTLGLEDLGLSNALLECLRSKHQNWGDEKILAELLKYMDAVNRLGDISMNDLLVTVRAAAGEWFQVGSSDFIPFFTAKDMETLLLYYSDLSLDEIEMCMMVFTDEQEKTFGKLKSRHIVAEVTEAVVIAAMVAGTAYGLAPYFIPGSGLLVEKAADKASSGNTTVFWSGSEDISSVARKWAEVNDATTLEMTQVGQELINLGQGAHYPTRALWESASRSLAESAQGVIHVFQPLMAKAGVDVGSIWATIEYPALISNPNVTGFVYHLVTNYGNMIEIPVMK